MNRSTVLRRFGIGFGIALFTWINVEAADAVATLAGGAGISGHSDGVGTAARFADPVGLAIDADGNILLADSGNHCLRRITPAGIVSTLAGGPGLAGSADGVGTAARFDSPSALAVAPDGTVYISDTGNHTLRRLDRNGRITTLAGLAGVSGATNGVGSQVRFNAPLGLAVTPSGDVFVADSGNHVIRRIDTRGQVTSFAGILESWGEDNGPGNVARFNGPVGLALDRSGNLVVADSLSHTLRRISPDGTVALLAGKPGEDGSTDGPAKESRFGTPAELAFDARGNLYVTDAWFHTLRRITPGGQVSTVAGLAGAEGSGDGSYTAARFFNPYGLVVTPRGSLVMTDTFNQTLRELHAPFALTVTLPAGAGALLRWESQPGARYQVFARNALDAPWTILGTPLTASGVTTDWTDSAPGTTPHRWYQVNLLPPGQ